MGLAIRITGAAAGASVPAAYWIGAAAAGWGGEGNIFALLATLGIGAAGGWVASRKPAQAIVVKMARRRERKAAMNAAIDATLAKRN